MRRLADVALPAYIASVEVSRDLVCTINRRPDVDRPARLTSAIERFIHSQCPDLDPETRPTQRALDEAASAHRMEELLARQSI